MTTSTITRGEPASSPRPSDQDRLIPLRVKAVLAVLGMALVGFIGYGIGTNHGTGAHILVGRAYVSPVQGTVKVGDEAYGFQVSPNGMDWYDSRGGAHEGGIPPCLRHAPRMVWIRFGYASATGLDGDSWRVVTWVQCVHHP